MKSPTRPAFPRISPAESQLLRACTQAEPGAQSAWEQWQSVSQVETAGPRSQAMFSMLYANLIAGTDSPEANLLKGVHKRTWYANQVLIAKMIPLLEQFKASEIAVMVLNDVSLVKGYYPDIGYRTIHCIDLLVHIKDWNNSLSLASKAGWQLQADLSFDSAETLSITTFKGPEKQCLRVWTNLFVAAPQQDTEVRLWQLARSLEFNGLSVLALGPVEQLLCLGVEACRDGTASLSLYADAFILLKLLGSNDDWSRLVWQAQRYECILPLRNMLAFLSEYLSAAVPSWVSPALHKMAISHLELLQYHGACESPALRFKSACLRLASHLRTGESRG